MAKKVLVVDDEKLIVKGIRFSLEQDGMEVDCAYDGEEALKMATENAYDMILLDIMLPGADGYEIMDYIAPLEIPVIFLTAKASVADRVKGLRMGADDYLTKPFDRAELLARIQAVVRRSKGHANSVIRTGDVEVNLDTQTVSVNGETLHLTGKEYGIMELLSLRKGSTLNKDQFLNHLYGGIDEPELKIIDVFICKLRKKLEKASGGKNYIETVWGRGYVLRDPDEKI